MQRIYKSLFEPDYIKELIKINYNINSLNICLLNSGDNDVYKVFDYINKKKYILKIYKHGKPWLKNLSDYMFEINMLNYLQNNSFPVSYPIKNNSNKYLNNLKAPEGTRYWGLFTFLEGELEKNPTISKSYKYGKTVAKLHFILDNYNPKYKEKAIDYNSLILPTYNFIKNKIKKEVYELGGIYDLDDYFNNLINSFQNYKANNKNDWGIIGGDLHGFNHVYDQKGEIHMFDFDFASYGLRTYDISVYIWLLISVYNKKLTTLPKLISAYLNGYSSVRNLTKDSIATIPLLVELRHLWIIYYHGTRKDVNYPDKCLQTLFLQLKEIQDSLRLHKDLF